MSVSDNGVGIFPGCRRKANSFGLVGIKERISALGGEFSLEAGEENGTSLTVSIPLEGAAGAISAEGDDYSSGNLAVGAAERRVAEVIGQIATSAPRKTAPKRKKEKQIRAGQRP